VASLNAQKALRCQTHETIAKVSNDMGKRFTFNTAIASVMELLNALYRFEDQSEQGRAVMQEALEAAALLLSPITPHVSHSLWQTLGGEGAVITAVWPIVDEDALVKDSIELVVQVNGKLRGRINVATDAAKDVIETAALNDENVQRFLEGQSGQESDCSTQTFG